MLSGCWTTPIKVETKVEMLPDTMMASPCDKVSAGKTVESLAQGYITNTKCLDAHKKLLERQRQYKKQIEEKYGK